MQRLLLPFLLLGSTPSVSSGQWQIVDTGAATEFRGLDAAGPRTVWVSGRGGVVARSIDGGRTWRSDTVPGAADLFLFDVHAVSATTAYVLGTHFDGGLARIYKTADGGRSWVLQFEDAREGAFYDGLAFWDDSTGVAYGDPVDGTFTVAITRNGGARWHRLPASALPRPLPGEAGFAASGRGIAVQPGGLAWIATGGGTGTRVLRSTNFGARWTAVETPLPAGNASSGLFAVDFRSPSVGLAVGGNYQQPNARSENVTITRDGGLTWTTAGGTLPPGVKYGIAAVPGTTHWVAVAPAGAGMSRDDGRTWQDLGLTGFNTVHFETAEAGWMAGTNGRVAIYGRDRGN